MKTDEQQTTLVVNPPTNDDTRLDTDAQTPVSASLSASMTSLGGRVRKTTQMFTFAQAKSDLADEFSPPVGKGTKVRNMEFVKNNVVGLGKKQQDMIKQLYNIMFGRRFQQKNVKVIKEHILDFSGIIEQDEKSREQLIAKMGKWKLAFVHEVMDLLAVDRSKKSFDEEGKPHNKESLLERLVDWLYNPQETKLGEKKAVTAAKKLKQKANKRAKAAKKSESKPAKKKQKTSKKEAVVTDEGEDEGDHEVTESDSEESSSDFEESKKTTRKVTRRPKKPRIVESDKEDEESEKGKSSSAEKNKTQPGVESENAADVAGKEEAKSAALDATICSKVRDIIANGNAEELTVKKIVRQLSADLGRDMSAQKKAIKEFITNDQMKV